MAVQRGAGSGCPPPDMRAPLPKLVAQGPPWGSPQRSGSSSINRSLLRPRPQQPL